MRRSNFIPIPPNSTEQTHPENVVRSRGGFSRRQGNQKGIRMLVFHLPSAQRAPSAPSITSVPSLQVPSHQVFKFPTAQHPHTRPHDRKIPKKPNEATATPPKPLPPRQISLFLRPAHTFLTKR